MATHNDPEPLDEEILAGLMDGYLRFAVAQQERAAAAGTAPAIAEDSDHNRFLWIRLRYPGFFRHVAREMAIPKYQGRIEEIATAVATVALQAKPTLGDWARAMSGGRRHSSVARRQQRAVRVYLPDVIRSSSDPTVPDRRMKTFTTAFDPVHGGRMPREPTVSVDRDRWKLAPAVRFKDLDDQLAVSALLLCAYPEQLRVWLEVAKAVRDAASHLGASKAARTITHPLAINVLANHAASITANVWWMDRSEERQQELLGTPRIFGYDDEDAVAAGNLWLELAQIDPRWAQLAQSLLPDAALSLHRWGTPGPAGVLLRTASSLAGFDQRASAAMLANAGYSFRVAGRFEESVSVYERALATLDAVCDDYLRVVTRVNLAEALRGPAGNPRASALLKEALRAAGSNPQLLAAFWRNCTTMFHRLGDERREEAALDGLLPHLGSNPEAAFTARQRMLELNASAAGRRPLPSAAALEP